MHILVKFRDFWWFWTIFNEKMDILDPFWGSWREAAARPCLQSCLWAGGPAQSLANPCRDPKFWLFGPLFPIEKVNFVILPIGVSENAIWPYFDPIWALLNPKPLAPGQNVPIRPTAQEEGPEDPQGPQLTLFYPFWTLWGSWREAAAQGPSCL